ncbi:daptide-type RiPP [Streptomyces sp. NPDC006512]|uniref:daptide-type RiPP n=1 Tax=Streptomyces sp. NPDC006512 TaxID=3154307 RepID=UPI0033A369AD
MTEQNPTDQTTAPATEEFQPETTELEMQELEALESPGFWTGVSIGTMVSVSVVVAT